MMMRNVARVVVMVAMLAGVARGEIAVGDGQTIAFMGDSITQAGGNSPGGYARLVIRGLEANGIKAKPVFAGVSGHKSNQMLNRLGRDVLEKKPDWMTLSCGVNDVWHGERGVPLEDYKRNITAIVDQAQAAGVKVVILTATMIGEDQANANNQKLIPYNEFLRELAQEKGCRLADLNADMQAAVEKANEELKYEGHKLTTDGVHMAVRGNVMMAEGVLRAFGLDEAEMETARAKWRETPGVAEVSLKMPLTLREYETLEARARERGESVAAMVKGWVKEKVEGE